MGNHHSLINYHAPLNFAQDLSEQLIDQGMLLHPGLGQIQLWKIKEINQPMLFSFHVHIYEKDSSIIEIHNFRSSLNHPNLIEYFACTSSQALNIGMVQSQQFFFAYHQKTIKEFIQTTNLVEVQIWKIIEQIVDVMVYLQRKNRYHGNINSESIFITDNFQIKLLDKIGQKPNSQAIKQDVHDLGILAIELLTKKTNQLNFISQIKNLHKKFTLQLLQLVAKMIDENIDKRPDFLQIQKMILNRLKEPIFFNSQERKYDPYKLSARLSKQENQMPFSDEIKSNQCNSPLSNQLSCFGVPQIILRCNTSQNLKGDQSKNQSPHQILGIQPSPQKQLIQTPQQPTTATQKKYRIQGHDDIQVQPYILDFNIVN
ncbi:unnamed protein product [Paramecium sonneborni]|uniref:Protein kinase domain-containing protein n=1 Tax=Paramecium sonneborni TaxID=65129 RepID=A0A8S1LGJ0_9CILI|nr:unnamed protein product [Paramecium sonneborni]